MLRATLFVLAIVQGEVASFSLAPAAGVPRALVAHSRQQQQRAAGLQLKAPEDPEHDAKVDKAL